MPGSARYPILCKGGQGLCGEREAAERPPAQNACLRARPALFSKRLGRRAGRRAGWKRPKKERPFYCRAQTDLWYNGLETVGSLPRRRGWPVWMRAGAAAAGAFAHRGGGAAGVSRPCRAAHPLPDSRFLAAARGLLRFCRSASGGCGGPKRWKGLAQRGRPPRLRRPVPKRRPHRRGTRTGAAGGARSGL